MLNRFIDISNELNYHGDHPLKEEDWKAYRYITGLLGSKVNTVMKAIFGDNVMDNVVGNVKTHEMKKF